MTATKNAPGLLEQIEGNEHTDDGVILNPILSGALVTPEEAYAALNRVRALSECSYDDEDFDLLRRFVEEVR
jgi:hypothetical protein